MLGANLSCFFREHNDTIFDKNFMVSDHKPYLLQMTMLVESPMKLFILNQNHSSVIFGSQDEEVVKNVVKFEAKMQYNDLLRVVPYIDLKPEHNWKITDFNYIMNENPFFSENWSA